MARPESRQLTLPTNDAPIASTSLRAKQRRSGQPRQSPNKRRSNSLRHAQNSTEALRARAQAGRGNSIRRGGRKPSPDDGAGARAGRQFTVGNIGNNGMLYLRPVVRPAHEKSLPPAPPFANAPPRRSFLAPDGSRLVRPVSDAGFEGAYSRPDSPTTPPKPRREDSDADSDSSPEHTPPRADSIRRPRSFSTVDELEHIYARSTAPGTFRVIINRPSPKKHRQKQSEDHLKVPIPSHKIGQPEFGARGTPILRTSSYGPEMLRHSASVSSERPGSIQVPQPAHLSRRHSDMLHSHSAIRAGTPQRLASKLSFYARERQFYAHAAAFDHLESHPVDPALIKFADFKGPKKRRILVATPLCLVAQVTSSTDVDYDLLSDFFMTFRQFMKKRDLVELLHDRFLWAAGRPGNTGTTVRVRVFVAFRHWILNYMAEDFVSDYSMRAEFCSLINDLYNSLFEAGLTGPKGLHQIAELKRCWREFISIYFNDPVGDHDESPNAAIHPGGRPGSHQEVWDNALSGEGQLNGTDLERWVAAANARYQRSKTEPAAIIPPIQHGQQPSTNTGTTARMTTITTAPTLTHSGNTHDSVPFTRGSEKSVQVLSCSIPFRPMHRGDHGDEIVLYRQPPPRTVALPRQVISPLKANRPNVAPRKVESVPEGLGQPRPQAEQTESSPTRQETQDTTTSRSGEMYLPTFPGDLVKGRTIQPLAPDITYWNTNSFLISDREASPGSGPGVRRIFGTVRRALSHKQTPDPGQRDRHGDHLSIVGTSDGPPAQEAPSLSSSGHSVSRTTKSLSSQLVKEPRADFLGDRALDNFNKAIAVGLARYGGGMSKGRMPQTDVLRSNKALPQLPPLLRAPPRGGSHRRDMSGNVTMGSRSIVIMHEGLALNPPQTEKTTSGAIVTSSPVAENEEPYHVTTPTIIRTFFDDGEVLHGDDVDEVEVPVEFSGQDSWYKDEDEQADQYVPSGRSGLASSNVIPSHETSISGNGSALAKEIEATLGHQHVSSIEDPVLPDDPQPVRSLRRRHGGNLRQAIPDFEMDEDLVRPPAPEPWDSDEDEIFEQELATPSPASHLSLVPAEDYPQLLPEALEAPEAGAGILGVAVQEQLKSILFPDDPNEDGSPTAALMKLEGRYVSPLGNVDAGSPLDAEFPSPSHHYDDPDQERYRHRHEHVMDANQPIHELRPSAVLSRTSTAVSERERHRHNVSEASYSSIPLLERGLADTAGPGGSRRQHVDSDSSNSMANFRFPAERRLRAVNPDAASADGESLEHVERTPSLDRITHGDTVPLDVELAGHDRNDSADLASEDGLPVAVAGRAVRSFYEDEAVVGAEEFAEDDYDDGGDDSVFEHPMRHPSTPPPTAGRSPGNVHGVRMSNGLPTPAQSPTANRSQAKKPVPNYSAGVYVPRGSNVGHDESGPQLRIDPPMRPKKHSPFFLKLNPKRMAEAMTLVEQSALAQVNWRELIELSWSKSGLDKIRDWASFVLPTSSSSSWQPPKSVDIIIARFNVVLKWAVSEIVLTEDLSERRSTIRHYIRIAAAARDMRNFATMYQLTMALLSADVSGLKETWHFVPAEDKALLKGLEKLVTPQKNFAMLRREQEGVVVDKGCIPFFGVYINDLSLNAAKSATVEPSLGQAPDHVEPLVNFERYQAAASIAKTVLRLVDASKTYDFDVAPALLSRCLWMSALGDEEIRARSRALGM